MDEYCTQVPLPKEKSEILHEFMNVALCKEKEISKNNFLSNYLYCLPTLCWLVNFFENK